MNTEKLEKLKKSLDNKFIPDNMKDKIRVEIQKLESEIKTDDTITATEVKEEVKEIEKKVEKALELAEKKEEQSQAKAPRKPRQKKDKETETKKPKSNKKSVFSVAKEIRKEGESWDDAKKRASKIMKSETTENKTKVRTETSKLLASIRRNKEYQKLSGNSDIKRDASRRALSKGKRVSKDGNVYYENRANRVDVGGFKSAYLEDGGGIEKYRIFEGVDHFKNKPIYRVEDVSEDGEYVGEWHTNIKDAEKELKDLTASYEGGGSLERERFNKFISSQINYIISLKTISQKREPIQNLINNMDDYTGEEIQKRITKDNLKYALQQKTVSKINEVLKTSLNALSYANGGTIIGTPETPLGRDLGISYTGLVGETGAMSSGELFEDGGSIPNNYKDRTSIQVWSMWTQEQKLHFLVDHFNNFNVEDFGGKNLIDISKLEYKNLPLLVRLELDFHVEKGQYADGGKFETPYNVIYKTKSGRVMVANRIMAINEDEAKEKLQKQMRASSTFDKIIMAHETFSDGGYAGGGYVVIAKSEKGGGFVMSKPSTKAKAEKLKSLLPKIDGETNEVMSIIKASKLSGLVGKEYLKYEDGGTIIGTPETPLGRDLGISYTGLVGETGAMSSGEMFMDGGSTGLPAGAEQQYVNHYLNEGASAGVFEQGGSLVDGYLTDPNFGDFQASIYAEGGSLGNHGLKQGDQIIKTMSRGVQKVKTKSGDIVYVNLANGYRGSEPPMPFSNGGLIGKEVTFMSQGEKDRGIIGEVNEDGSLAVDTGRSLRLVEEDEIVEIHDKPKKRGFFFATGGELGKNKTQKELRVEFLEKLGQGESKVWDKIGAESGSEIRNNEKMLKAYAEGVQEMLEKEGVGKGAFNQEDYNFYTDENWHLFNEFLVWNGYYAPEMTKTEKAWREKNYADPKMRNYVSNPSIISLSSGSKSKSTNYVAKDKIATITIVKDGKETILSSKDVLNGANLYDGGGKLKNDHTYFAKRYIKEVITEDGDKLKPSNGYWIKKGAKPIHTSKYDDGGQLEMKFASGGTFVNWNKFPDKKVLGFYNVKGKDINVDVNLNNFERLDDLSYSLYPTEKDRKYFKSIEVKSTALNSLSKGLGVKAVTNDGKSVVIKRLKDLSYAGGGKIQQIKNKIIITDANDNEYVYGGNDSNKLGYLVPYIDVSGRSKKYWEHHFIPKETWINIDKIKDFSIYPISKSDFEKLAEDNKKETEEILLKFKSSFSGGGKTTFKEKATAIAKNFEGKKVKPEYQKEYGKTYDKAEAKEVGNKIAGSQKAKYDSKMSGGGKTKRGGAMVLAKQIRKEGESWASALKRANEQMKKK